jgi:hypothetical protein
MNRKSFTAFVLCTSAVLALAVTPRSFGQAASAPSAGTSEVKDEDVVKLSPFVVNAEEDRGSYAATSTLAGTRVRTDLKDLASSISVVTQQFLQDTGAKNNADLLVYMPSSEVAGIRGNFSGVAGTNIYQENTISTTTRVRGLDSADNTRDYFISEIPWDGYNVGRVDLQRGPNSILFGTGSPAGIINTSVNDANFKTAYNVENRIDQYSSMRNSIDLNQVLIPNMLAVRVAALKDNELYEQQPAFNNATRYYGALRFDPKLFANGHTSLKVKYENGDVKSNNPRQIPPGDNISQWFRTSADAYGNPGYNKFILNQYNRTSPTPWGSSLLPRFAATMAGGGGSDRGILFNGLSLTNQGRSYWGDVINYYENTPTSANYSGAVAPSGTPMFTVVAQPYTRYGILDSGGSTLGALDKNFIPAALPMITGYVPNLGNQGTNFPGGAVPGAIFYANKVLQDPSVFNFYKNLMDGPNKHEWQNWTAINATIEQTFFNDRLGIQFAFDHQDYTAGAEQWMAGENYQINIDINATYADGSANPNVGRPYVGNGASAPGLNYQNRTVRNGVRITPTYELRTEDFLGNSSLSKILGKHVLTGLYETNRFKQEYINFAEFATSADFITQSSSNANAANTLGSNRSFEWISYIGPSLLTKSSAANANLRRIDYVIAPPTEQAVWSFNSVWNKPTSSTAAGYVDPTAPYTYLSFKDGSLVNGHESDNPANYVGWSQQQIHWLKANNASDFPDLVQSANRTLFRNISQGATWQGYFFGGDLVGIFGWRKDVITNFQTNAPTNALSGYTSLEYPDDYTSRHDQRGESKSWGGVYHLSKALAAKLPWDSTVSVFFNRSQNFKIDTTRLDMAGNAMPNAQGKTTDYGFTITTLGDKLSLKLTRFKTKVANATLADTQGNSIGGLGQNGYFLADGLIWGYGWATMLQKTMQSGVSSVWDNSGDYAAGDGMPRSTPAENTAANNYLINGGNFTDTGGVVHHFIGGNAIVNAWLHLPVPANFFSSFHLSPAIDPSIAARTGNLTDSYYLGNSPMASWNVGGGSSFGNHQTTVDNLSHGTEVELSYQPMKNWNMTVNYAKVYATHENIDPVSASFIGTMTAFMNGPGGQVREWGNGAGSLLGPNGWNTNIVGGYTVLLNGLGHAAPEVSPWRLNLVTTYTLDRGAAKGVFFGGALRVEAGRIIGYHFDSNFVNANARDPNYAAVTAVTSGGLNVNQPFMGKNESHVDAWIGYSRKITQGINWRIQVNLRSVFEKDRLIASRINPDGNIALARIAEGMGWQLTNSFTF